MDNAYDIPDEKRPEQELSDPARDLNDKYMYNVHQIQIMSDLRQEAIKMVKIQNDGWDRCGDLYVSRYLRNFVVENKNEIIGILKDLEWIDYGDDWDINIRYYYRIAQEFIKRSRYAINNYKKANKKINKQRR